MKPVEIIVSQIIEWLKQGDIPWKKTWVTKWQKNIITKVLYQGFNQMLLSYIANKNNWSNYWVTYKQALDLKWYVKKDETSTKITKYVINEKEVIKEWKVEKIENRQLLYFNVYNLSQCEWIEIPQDDLKEVEVKKNIDDMVFGYMEREWIRFWLWEPAYSPLLDEIYMPWRNCFRSWDDFYKTFYHEITHSTWHSKRMNRWLSTDMMNEKYSKEELVAEIGSAILCNETEVVWNTKEVQAYINGWIQALEDKPNMILQASKKAVEASKFYLNIKD